MKDHDTSKAKGFAASNYFDGMPEKFNRDRDGDGCNRSRAGGRGTAIWRVSPPPTPPHNVADLTELVPPRSSAATLRGGGTPDP
jgi:hypothetical protein